MAAAMEEEDKEEAQDLQTLSNLSDSPDGKSRQRRRRSSGSSNGSFEFCVLRKPNLLSADQLISGGVLLPFYGHSSSVETPETNPLGSFGEEENAQFNTKLNPPDLEPDCQDLSEAEQPDLVPDSDDLGSSPVEKLWFEPELEPPGSEPVSDTPDSNGADNPEMGSEPGPEISAAVVSSSTAVSTSSKRWRDIFKRAPKGGEITGEKLSKDKKGSTFGAHAAELVLNINIWPFRRSNSAGNGGAPPTGARMTPPRSSSAPCSPAEFNFKRLPIPPKRRGNVALPARRSVSGAAGTSKGILTKPADKVTAVDRNHGVKGYSTKEGGNKGLGKVSPAAGDGGDWYKARVLTMKASMSSDASGSGGGGGVAGGGKRSNLRTLFANKMYEI